MGDDFQRLQEAEERLLEAVRVASEVTSRLSAGTPEEVEALCSQFLDNIEESQAALLQLATKYSEPLPYQNSDYAARLEQEAAEQRLRAAQAQAQAHMQGLPQQLAQQGEGGGEQGGDVSKAGGE